MANHAWLNCEACRSHDAKPEKCPCPAHQEKPVDLLRSPENSVLPWPPRSDKKQTGDGK